MHELKRNVVISAAIHAAVILSFSLGLCRASNIGESKIFLVRLDQAKTCDTSSLSTPHFAESKKRSPKVEPSNFRTPIQEDDHIRESEPEKKERQSIETQGGTFFSGLSHAPLLSEVSRSNRNTSPGYNMPAKTAGHDQNDLRSAIRQAIEKAKTYPPLARKRRIEGTAVAGFRIDDRGSPAEMRIEQTSGYEILDRAVLDIVKRASPFPKMEGRFTVPITFKLTDPGT